MTFDNNAGFAPAREAAAGAGFWRNDITGLRALAVLPVLLYHGFPGLVPSGFFGVDIFFVISGYLISGIVFRDLLSGRFSFLTFYQRRIRRILPNLLLVLGTVLVLGWFIMTRAELKSLSQHLTASCFFFQNISLMGVKGGYWADSSQLLPMLHLWSLAVEEQFYIAFPLICFALWRINIGGGRRLIALFVVLLTILSLAGCLAAQDANKAFYWPLYRFWELGAGIVLACAEKLGGQDCKRLPVLFRQLLSLAGFLAIMWAMMTPTAVHPSAKTILPVAGAFAIITAGPECLVNRLLSIRCLVFIGLISYSLYLWHWPLLAYLRLNCGSPSALSVSLVLGLSFVVSSIVYQAVENPVRRSTWHCGKVGAATVLLCLLVLFDQGQKVLVAHAGAAYGRETAARWEQYFEETRRWIDWGKTQQLAVDGIKLVQIGEGSAVPGILFIGDSHTEQYYYRIEKLAKETGKSAWMAVRMLNGEVWDNKLAGLEALLEHPEIRTVVFASKWGDYSERSFPFAIDGWISFIREAIARHPEKRWYIVLDAPWDGGTHNDQMGSFDIATHVSRLTDRPEEFAHLIVPYPESTAWKKGNEIMEQVFGGTAAIIRCEDAVCPDGMCDIGERYRDDDHLKPRWLEKHAVWLDRVFADEQK